MLGPLGLGVLYGETRLLDALPPFLTGGSMIAIVTIEATTCAAPAAASSRPGARRSSQAIGLGAARGLPRRGLGLDGVAAHEIALTAHALDRARGGRRACAILGPLDGRGPRGRGRRSVAEGSTRTTSASASTSRGVAVRAGHHCAPPLQRVLRRQPATARASAYLYNFHDEIDVLADGIRMAQPRQPRRSPARKPQPTTRAFPHYPVTAEIYCVQFRPNTGTNCTQSFSAPH